MRVSYRCLGLKDTRLTQVTLRLRCCAAEVAGADRRSDSCPHSRLIDWPRPLHVYICYFVGTYQYDPSAKRSHDRGDRAALPLGPSPTPQLRHIEREAARRSTESEISKKYQSMTKWCSE